MNPRAKYDARLVVFLGLFTVVLIAGWRAWTEATAIAVDVLTALAVLVLAFTLTERRHAWGLGLGNKGRGGLAVVAGIPATFAAMGVLGLSAATRDYYLESSPDVIEFAIEGLIPVLRTEVCFRGALLFALAPRIGAPLAVGVAAVPYGLLHIEKPLAEALGSVPVGLALGALALWTRSIWYGVLLHLLGGIVFLLLFGN